MVLMLKEPKAFGSKPMYLGRRKTPFLGLVGATMAVRSILDEMRNGTVDLDYLLFYKASQDHVEILFSASIE